MQWIMVGIDGSKGAVGALRWAGRLAQDIGAKVTAVHSYRRPYAEIAPDEHDRMLAERTELVTDQWLIPLDEFGVDAVVQVVEGDPRTSMPPFVNDERPDLLVLGRTGIGGNPGFLHLGSVVEHVAHHVNCPLAVIPPGDVGPIKRVVIGVDGSEESAAAIGWCAEVIVPLGAETIAVTVEEPLVEWTPSWDERNWRHIAEVETQRWVKPITAAGGAVHTVAAAHLSPADGLLGIASTRGADLLVVGTRGAGGFTGLRFGGVAMKILHRASLPVVLVPPTTQS